MIEIPWDGPCVIVPAEAVEVLYKFNQNFNYAPLLQCRDCKFWEPPKPKQEGKRRREYDRYGHCGNGEVFDLSIAAPYMGPKDFRCCAKPRETPCRNTDEKTGASFANLFGILAGRDTETKPDDAGG